SFSGRVAMRRRFLSQPTARSTMLRLRYCSRSKTGLLTGPPSALLDLVTALGDPRPYFVAPAPGLNGLRGVSLISRKALGPLTGPAVVQRHPLLRSWETASFTHPVLQFCCDFTS